MGMHRNPRQAQKEPTSLVRGVSHLVPCAPPCGNRAGNDRRPRDGAALVCLEALGAAAVVAPSEDQDDVTMWAQS